MDKALTWDLEIMYKGYDDPKYSSDKQKLEELIKTSMSIKILKEYPKETIRKYLELSVALEEVIMELFAYSSLRVSTNVNDYQAMAEMGKIRMQLQALIPSSIAFEKFLKPLNLDEISKDDDLIKEHLFILKKMQDSAKHSLSDKEELIASKLSLVGSNAWSNLQSSLTANLSIEVKGFEKPMPLSAVRNLAYDPSSEVRRNAYDAEIKAYKQIEASVAMALNNIKREVNILVPMRKYKDALDVTLKNSNMSKKTLNALISAMNDAMPKFRKYFQLKAKALGHKNGLPFYDLFAPMGHLVKNYSYEEASNLVIEVYDSFSKKLGDMARRAFSERWIDVLPHEGKRGGAFCAGLSNHGQSRVLTNFTGSLGDVQTLAHELGHAYHGQVTLDNSPLNREYPMPLAETASIFCQTLMTKKMLNDLDDPLEKLTVVEQSLQEDSQCIVDILSRYLFETDVLSKPVEVSISSEEMCKMMLDAQSKTYGDGLDKEYMHPYMWLCKSHYYSAGLNFYNWPYAFGTLYGKGLYKQYLKDKDGFVKKYDEMLRRTGYMSVEEVAASMGIDVTKKAFWKESIDFILEDVELFKKLLKETKLIK